MTETITPKLLIDRVNAPVLAESQAVEIVTRLDEIMARAGEFIATAKAFACESQGDVDRATLTAKEIDADIKTVTALLGDAKKEAHARHKLFTSVENFATDTHNLAKKELRRKVAAWMDAEREKAKREQERLQRIADEQAERERRAALKKAAAAKKPETQEKYQEQAAAVQATVIHVEAPKATGMNLRKTWRATVTDLPAFLRYVADNPRMSDYVDIRIGALQKDASGLSLVGVPGIHFEQVTR